MKYAWLFALALVFFVGSNAQAVEMKLTIYDDGISCPGGCDAHVVINPANNGTINAYAPTSSRTAPKKCVNGDACTICFTNKANSCMQATYRGGGPPSGTFDFTPAFYAANCGKSGIPSALVGQCSALDTSAKKYSTQPMCGDG